MKSALGTSLLLILIYFGTQILAMGILLIPFGLYSWLTDTSFGTFMANFMGLSSLLAALLMSYYLYKKRYFNTDKKSWSLDYPLFTLLLLFGITFSYILAYDPIDRFIALPDIMAGTFEGLSNNLWGILAISIVGPILEELLFRGSIQKLFMEKATPVKAILISSLIFGLIHGNPAQIVNAFFIGIILGWLYYKTGSLVPSILIHVINNSFSTITYQYIPDADSIVELTGPATYWYWVIGGALVLTGCIWLFNKRPTAVWTTQTAEFNVENNREINSSTPLNN